MAGSAISNDGDVTGNHGSYDFWVVKLGAEGNPEWQKSLGGSDLDAAHCIQQTKDGGFIVAGISQSVDGDVTGHHGDNEHIDAWALKLDMSGNLQWQKSLGGSNYDAINSVQQTADGGYIFAGYSQFDDGDVTKNYGGTDYWIIKLDSSGAIKWQESLGGSGSDNAQSVIQTFDVGYIVAGLSGCNDGLVSGNHGNNDYWIVKLDTIGNIQGQQSLGGTWGENAESILQLSDSGYIVAGSSGSDDGDVTENHGFNLYNDYWIVRLDTSGNIQWQKSLGGSYDDNARSIQTTMDKGFIITGSSYSFDGDVSGHYGSSVYDDYWVTKLDSTGNLQWQKSLGGNNFDESTDIRQSADGGYIVAGFSYSSDGDITGNHGGKDSWIIKLAPEILPVKWLAFDGILQNNEALLNWSTAAELNNKGFEVQRSIDGRIFNPIGFVRSNGNSSNINYYTFEDMKVANGLNYYRLKQVDNDGKTDYSSVINLNYSGFEWAVLGNPSANDSWVRLQLDKKANVSIQLISINGSVIQTINKGNIAEGTYSIPLDLNTPAKGLYVVRLMINGASYSKKLIK